MHLNQRVHARAAMRGLSLVELMVGIAVSLFVVAAAALMTSSQLSDNRSLLLETQLQQDLRATADIITRDLRRSSYWHEAFKGAPAPSGVIETLPNPQMAMSVSTSASSAVFYRYRRSSGLESFGFRLNNAGVIQTCLTDGSEPSGFCNSGWQDLTDANTMKVTEFRVDDERAGSSANDDLVTLPCPYPCADGTAACWPKVGVREFTVVITAEARNNAAVQRTLRSSVRVRNDRVNLSTEAPAQQACPVS
jgi:Tfp pilus assembly protein PilW